jgi:hypothetical protein
MHLNMNNQTHMKTRVSVLFRVVALIVTFLYSLITPSVSASDKPSNSSKNYELSPLPMMRMKGKTLMAFYADSSLSREEVVNR